MISGVRTEIRGGVGYAVEAQSDMLGSKICVCPPQAKNFLLFGSKMITNAQFGASKSGVGSRNQALAKLILTPGSKEVLAWAKTWPNPVLANLF